MENRKQEAIDYALQINNTIDCDVIQDAVNELQNAESDEDIIEALKYLSVSLKYRKIDTFFKNIKCVGFRTYPHPAFVLNFNSTIITPMLKSMFNNCSQQPLAHIGETRQVTYFLKQWASGF